MASAMTAEHRFKSHRIGSEECASYGSKDLAGEARRWDSVEQYGSVVSLARSKACDRSLSTTAAWTGGRCIGSTKVITKFQVLASVQAVELYPEHICKDDVRRAPMRFYSTSVGVATA